MKLLILLATVAFFACAALADESPYFAPGVIDRVPIGKERTRGNKIHSATECSKRGGEWFSGKGYAYCVLPYRDAGTLCRNSKECIGHCTMPLNKKTLDGHPLPEGLGLCQLNDTVDDCGRHHFENGKVIIYNCD